MVFELIAIFWLRVVIIDVVGCLLALGLLCTCVLRWVVCVDCVSCLNLIVGWLIADCVFMFGWFD